MKKSVFILVVALMSVFFHLKAQDTLIFQAVYPFPIDTINKTYIYPEVVNPTYCYDQGPNDPVIGNYWFSEISRLTCDGRALKAVAQGFMFNDTTAVDGITGWFGNMYEYNAPTISDVNFKIGIMDNNYNIIYQKDYLFVDANNQIAIYSFEHIPFDSVLYLNDFVYVFIEWPDSACFGGIIQGELYYDDSPKFYMRTHTEEKLLPDGGYDILTENFCAACNVKYSPLFKWYGDSYWVDLNSMRCEHLNRLCYWGVKDGVEQALDYYPTLGINFYYSNDNNNEDGGDSGLSEMNISHLVSLSPNPANDVVTVQSSFKIREIEIHNTLGQVVLRKEGSQNIETLDVSILESGVYVVRIKTQRGFANKKILIE